MNQFLNLIKGKISKKGSECEIISPIDNSVIGKGRILSKRDVSEVFENNFPLQKSTNFLNKLNGLDKLSEYIAFNKDKFVKQITLDTGYTLQDSKDIVEGSIEFVKYFNQYLNDIFVELPLSRFSYSTLISRQLQLLYKPYGVIAIMTPQNAPLILELTVILNGLAGGNNVIVRSSSQCMGTISLLIDALLETLPLELLSCVSILSCKAPDFLELSYQKANLIHYIGGSYHGKNILSDSLTHNIKAIVDGEGASTIIVDDSSSLDEAVKACKDGLVRCNGELCSTVRVIAVDYRKYGEFVDKLGDMLTKVDIGNPLLSNIDMGPLFNNAQAERLYEISKEYSVISGEGINYTLGGNYTAPLLCELKSDDMSFLQQQFYGPMAGVVSYKGDDWKKWLKQSPFRLNDGVFSNNKKFIEEFILESNAPRIVVNHDPSIESVFEPWGGFLPSGSNDVSFWLNKYRKIIQLDTN